MLESFWKGMFAGLLFGLPAGPAGILVLRTWLTRGRFRAALATLGMALADGFVAALALYGLGAVTVMPKWQITLTFFKPAAGIVLIATGVGFLLFEKDEKRLGHGRHPAWDLVWPAGLVLTHPGLWAAYAALLLALDIPSPNHYGVTIVGLGTTTGVLLLWGLAGVFLTRRQSLGPVDEQRLTAWADRVTGVLLIIFGMIGLAS